MHLYHLSNIAAIFYRQSAKDFEITLAECSFRILSWTSLSNANLKFAQIIT